MSKFFKICLFLLIGLVSMSAGQWAVVHGNFALMVMHIVFASLFFWCVPVLIFGAKKYRLVSYIIEILFGFVVFSLLYLNSFEDVGNLSEISWMELMTFDSVGVMAVGFGGAMLYAESTKY